MSDLVPVALFLSVFALLLEILAWYVRRGFSVRVSSLETRANGPTKLQAPDQALLDSQSRSIRELEAEWATMYGKFDRTLKAMQARDRRDTQREPSEEEQTVESAGPVGQRTHADLRRVLRRR